MDAYEATRIVFSRIQSLDPENAAKIMGLLLIQDHGEKELIRLAFGPEALLQSVTLKAKRDLGLVHAPPPPPPPPPPPQSPPSPFGLSRQSSMQSSSSASSRFAVAPPPPLSIASPSWAPQEADLICSPGALDAPYEDMGWPHHRRSCSASAADLCLSPDGVGGFGWKPCLYFARGFCKNGSSCRFIHDEALEQQQQQQELMLLRSPTQRLSAAGGFPYSPMSTMNYLMQQQQQNESQRAAVAASLLMSPRGDFAGMSNPVSRQIYLTFPADSTFREEDVSNYFSIYGPVQDVRIPYQQKRMFGFVTFLYPETVKLILAKGNPHFVCDARVLVKPYKEKGKVPDKFRKHPMQTERGDFSGCTTPTGLDSRDPYDFQQLGARMLYNNNGGGSQEMLLRRKLEEQQAAELQQAIEMQGRRFMGLQLLDLKNRSLSSSATTAISSPTLPISTQEIPTEDKSPSPASSVGELQQVKAVNAAADEQESAAREGSPNEHSDFQESVEHNLPDSPFASPTKAASLFVDDPFAGSAKSAADSEFITDSSSGSGSAQCNGNVANGRIASPLLPQNSTIDVASFKSCFFPMPRYSSGHGAVGL